MKYVHSKMFDYTDGLSRLILKYCELLEDMVIAALKDESEISVG